MVCENQFKSCVLSNSEGLHIHMLMYIRTGPYIEVHMLKMWELVHKRGSLPRSEWGHWCWFWLLSLPHQLKNDRCWIVNSRIKSKDSTLIPCFRCSPGNRGSIAYYTLVIVRHNSKGIWFRNSTFRDPGTTTDLMSLNSWDQHAYICNFYRAGWCFWLGILARMKLTFVL